MESRISCWSDSSNRKKCIRDAILISAISLMIGISIGVTIGLAIRVY